MQRLFDIREYGARPDGRTINTASIQKAIDACHEAGGGRVLCGPGDFLTGSLQLRSNVELHLMPGCRIVGSTRPEDYEDLVAAGLKQENAPEGNTKSLLLAHEAENIAITGPGQLNGSGLAFYDTDKFTGRFFSIPSAPRPRMVIFYKCRNVRFEDASFVDCPLWTFWLMKCEKVGIHRISILGDQRMLNNDGIDLDACRDVTLSDSIIRTGDDCVVLRAIRPVYDTPAVCENITVTNCVLDSWCQGIRVGCPGDGVIRNCTFSNLVITGTYHGITFAYPKRFLPRDGLATADVHDILFSNIVISCDRTPINVIVEDGIGLRRLAGLSFSNCRIRSGDPCRVTGSPETIIRDVSFSNVEVHTSGEDAVLCRYCEGVKFTNVTLSNRPDGKADGPEDSGTGAS